MSFKIFLFSAIANQESLSALETEMRKLEGLVKEVVDEMGYLKSREQRFTDTNCAFRVSLGQIFSITLPSLSSFNKFPRSKLCMVHVAFSHRPWHMANLPPSGFLQTEVPYRLNDVFSPLISLKKSRLSTYRIHVMYYRMYHITVYLMPSSQHLSPEPWIAFDHSMDVTLCFRLFFAGGNLRMIPHPLIHDARLW